MLQPLRQLIHFSEPDDAGGRVATGAWPRTAAPGVAQLPAASPGFARLSD
jgi:hypothetical protein